MSGYWPSSGIPKPIETDALIVRSVDTSGNANTEKLYNFQTVPNAQIVKDPASTRPALQAERVGLTPALRRSLVAPRAEQSAPDNISAFISVSDQSFEFKSRRLSSVEHVFTVANISSKPLTISGILRECSCVGTPDVPIDIDANSAVNLHVVVSVGDQPGPFAKKLVVQFSQGGTHAFSLVLGIKGEITE
jgi:hypothetical protein